MGLGAYRLGGPIGLRVYRPGVNGGHIAKTSPIELYKFLVTHCGYMNGKTSFGRHRSAPASYQIFPYYSIEIGRSLFLGLIYSLLFSINLVTY